MCLHRKPQPLGPEAMSRRPEDPCRDPASEARDDWAPESERAQSTLDDYDVWHRPCEHCGYDPGCSPENRCWKCGRRAYRDFSDRALKKNARIRGLYHWPVHLPDPNDLEGPGPTDEERRVNAAAISKLTVQERLDLMFRGPNPESHDR